LQIEARQVENPNSDSFEFRKGIQGAFQKKKKRSTLTGGGYLSCDILRRDKLLARSMLIFPLKVDSDIL
jgi:hypothetical protein